MLITRNSKNKNNANANAISGASPGECKYAGAPNPGAFRVPTQREEQIIMDLTANVKLLTARLANLEDKIQHIEKHQH